MAVLLGFLGYLPKPRDGFELTVPPRNEGPFGKAPHGFAQAVGSDRPNLEGDRKLASNSLRRGPRPSRTLPFLKETEIELDCVLDYLRRETMAAVTERSQANIPPYLPLTPDLVFVTMPTMLVPEPPIVATLRLLQSINSESIIAGQRSFISRSTSHVSAGIWSTSDAMV